MRTLILIAAAAAAALAAPQLALADSRSAMKRVCLEAVTKKYGSNLARIDIGPIKPAPDSFSVDGTAVLADGTTKPFHCSFRQAPTPRTQTERTAQN